MSSCSDKKKVLIVDDELSMLRAVEYALQKENYETITARDGSEAIRQLFRYRPHLVLLDVMMPEMDGWETCRRIREVSDVPILMLTARGGEEDIVKGLDVGADDYIVKPFRVPVLLARVRAALRRVGIVLSETGQGQLSYSGGRLILDLDKRLVSIDGNPRPLSATEFRLLTYLIANSGRILSHEQLLAHVWGPEYINELDYVKVYIRSLRHKIEENPHQPQLVLGRRGLGYYFNASPD